VRVNTTGVGVAVSGDALDAVAAYVRTAGAGAPVPAQPVVAASFVSADGATTTVVVMNTAPTPLSFKLRDVSPTGAVRALAATIPAAAIQTYTYPTAP